MQNFFFEGTEPLLSVYKQACDDIFHSMTFSLEIAAYQQQMEFPQHQTTNYEDI